MWAWRISAAAVWLAPGPLSAAAPDGAALFAAHCAICHQANGAGAEGLAPSLAGTLKTYAASQAGSGYLSQIVISGMAGRIETATGTFMALMPSQATDLTDTEIAATVNYVLTSFNGAPPPGPIRPADVSAARAASPSPTDTRKLREKIRAAK